MCQFEIHLPERESARAIMCVQSKGAAPRPEEHGVCKVHLLELELQFSQS